MLHNFLFYSSLAIFRIVLDASYFLVLSKHFSSAGYELSFIFSRYALSWFFFLAFFLLVRSRFHLVRDYFFVTIALGLWAPITSLWGLDSNRPIFPLLASAVGYATVYFSIEMFSKFRAINIPMVKQGEAMSFYISLSLMAFLVFWYMYSGVSFNLGFSKVYEFRRANESLSAFGFFAYLNNWIYKIFAVFVLAFLLMKRRYLLASISVFVFIFYYAANAHKSVLLTPFLVVSIWFYFSRYRSLLFVPIGFSLIILMSILTFFILNDVWMSALFPSRVFMLPAHLTFIYFDFVENNQFLYYSNSVLKNIFEYPYDKGFAQVIGDYSGQPGSSANNGYVSSAYAQFGILAVVLYSAVIGFILVLVDKFVKRGEVAPWFALAILAVPIRDFLISIDLLTTMLTGGMLWAIILIFLSRKRFDL